jgi:acyl-CoA thioesterase-2
LQIASLDHTIWFHRPFRMDEWLLFSMESPNASGGRGLSFAHVYNRDRVLVATLAQEGLIRLREKPRGA